MLPWATGIYGRKLKNDWEIGLKFRYAGASPYTPFDLAASRLNYLSIGEGILDYNAVNSERLRPFKQVDLRVDKRWNFRKLTIDVFLDIQNITNSRSTGSLSYTFEWNADNTDFATADGEPVNLDGSNAIPKILKDDEGTILPSVGFIVEF